MACGLPVITTDVGGNGEVVCQQELGTIVPFGNRMALHDALQTALSKTWDRKQILAYAEENAWANRISYLTGELTALAVADIPAKTDMEAGVR